MVYILLFFNIIVNEKRAVAKGYFMQIEKKEQTIKPPISKNLVSSNATLESSSSKTTHKLELDYAKSLSMTGVVDVPVFTDKNLTVKLNGESLIVTGQNLSVKTLDVSAGKLVIEGKVFSLKYTSSTTPSSFAKKLFR